MFCVDAAVIKECLQGAFGRRQMIILFLDFFASRYFTLINVLPGLKTFCSSLKCFNLEKAEKRKTGKYIERNVILCWPLLSGQFFSRVKMIDRRCFLLQMPVKLFSSFSFPSSVMFY